eukprot:5999717-Pyramimonas_sp.AAC.1
MVARIPMEVDDVLQFVEEIADDVEFASKAMMRDVTKAWDCRCIEASVKGARALHRVTKVRKIPVPAVSQ